MNRRNSCSTQKGKILRAFEIKHPDRTCKLTLIALAAMAGRGGICRPSVVKMAEQIGVKRRQMFNVLARLESEGFFKRTQQRRTDGGLTRSEYQLTLGAGVVHCTTPLVQPTAPLSKSYIYTPRQAAQKDAIQGGNLAAVRRHPQTFHPGRPIPAPTHDAPGGVE